MWMANSLHLQAPRDVTCWWICVDGEQFTAAIMTVICTFCGRNEWNCENLKCLLQSSTEVLKSDSVGCVYFGFFSCSSNVDVEGFITFLSHHH